MKKKVISMFLMISIIIITLTQVNYGATTTRGAVYVLNDGSNDKIENNSIRIVQTIQNTTEKSFILKVEVENLQEEATEVALVLDNSFSMWSQKKIETYKEKMVDLVNEIYEKIPDTYMSLSGYNGTIQAITGNKEEIIEAINNITQYEGINDRTGLNYAKDSFTGKAKNKHIVVFTDGEETEEAKQAIQEIQDDKTLYLTATIIGENATKQTQYKVTTRTKVYAIEDSDYYNLGNLKTNITNWIYSTIDKEINNVVVNGKFTDELKSTFTTEIYTQPNKGQLAIDNDGYVLTVPQITTSKVTFYLKMNLNIEIDRSYLKTPINVIKSTTINYDDKRQETKTLEDTEKTPSVELLEHYTLEIIALNKEFQEIKVDGVKCTVIQKDKDGNVIETFENQVTNSEGKIILNKLKYVSESTFEINFISTPGPYEDKENEIIEINKDAVTGDITINNTTLTIPEGELVDTDNNEKVISAKVAIPPKAIVFNVTKTDEETGLPLSGVKYSLTQPQTGDIPANSVISGTTNSSGSTKLSGEVAGIQQTYTNSKGEEQLFYYTYMLKEEAVPTGYIDQNTTTTIKIHFSLDGEITSAYMINGSLNSKLTFENDKINIDLTNKMKYYTLNINAIDKEYNTIPVVGAKFQVTGVNETGVQVVNKTGTTDKNGNIKLEVNAQGKVTYTIKQIEEHAAYENAQDVQYILTRNFETNDLTLENQMDNLTLDNNSKVVTTTIPLTPKKFTVKVNKLDLDEKIPVEGVGLRLIQPDERDYIDITTASDGIATYTANVICAADGGTNTYYLEETQKATGYKQLNGKIGMNITFDANGNVTDISENSEFLEKKTVENKKVELDLMNEQQEYTIKVYAKHKNYNEIPIEGVNLKITGTTADDGTQFYQSNTLITDIAGIATSDNIKKAGDLNYTINTISVPKGYKLPEETTIKINKNLQTENLSKLDNNPNVEIDNTNKIVKVILYIEPETFTLQIDKKDIGLSDTLIGNAIFDVKQPEISYKNENNETKTKERNHVTGTTEANKTLELNIENPILKEITQRTFTYTLAETQVPSGYENTKFILNFDITFNDDGTVQSISNILETSQAITKGEITESKDDVTVEQEEYLKSSEVQNGKVILTIANKQKGATLKVKALNKKYRYVNTEGGVKVQGVTIQVIGKDENGTEFYKNNLITDENGYIQVSGISQTGDFSIELTAIDTPAGYLPGSTKTIYLNRDVLTTQITLKNSDADTENKYDNKIINTKMYIDVQTFNLEITKLEKLYGSTLIENAEFTIIQPDIDVYKRQEIKGKTVKNEKLIISPEVAGEGTYKYTIVENEPIGYINQNIKTTLVITFGEEGEIQSVSKATDDATISNESIVTLGNSTQDTIPLTIMNEQKPYTIRIQTLDAKCKTVPIEGIDIKLTGTTTQGEIYNEQKTTNENGIIEYSNLTQRGDIDFKIEQIKVPTGYEIGKDKNLKINKDWDTTTIILREDATDVEIDNTNKIVTVKLYIEPQTFEIHLDKVDKLDNSIHIAGATFELKQPKFKTLQEREVYSKTTSDNTLVFTAEVAGAGTYTYTLTETHVPSGYLALSKITNLNITFDDYGKVTKVQPETENEFVKIGTIETENVIPLQISNEKKVHAIKIIAMNEEYHDAKAEGVNIRLIGKDSNGNIITEKTGVTQSNGIVIFDNLEGSGNITYEIIQEEPRPAAFYLGENKTIQVSIDDATNYITNTTNDDVTSINNYNRQISTEIYLTPKKFTITLNKIDYDYRNLIGDAYISCSEAKWGRNLIGYTKENEPYVITGYVPGEGTFTYGLNEGYYHLKIPVGRGIPNGYQNYLNTHKMDIEFDSNGDILNANITDSTWFKVFWNASKGENYIVEYPDLKNHTIKLLNTENQSKENIDIELTNVKKQFTFNMNVFNSKYTNEKISSVHFRIIAQDKDGNEIYNQIQTTDPSGQINIGDQDFFRVTGEITFKIECLDAPSMFKEMPIATVVINRDEHPNQKITVDQVKTSSHVSARASAIKDIYNTSDFTYRVDVNVPLIQKTYDIDLTKVNSENENILLPGAKFTLTQPDGKHTQTEVTNEDGKLVLSADLYGEKTEYMYILTESEAPAGYTKIPTPIVIYANADDEEVQSVRVTDGSLYVNEVQLENSHKLNITVKNDVIPVGLFNVKVIEKYGSERVEGSKYNINISTETLEKLNVTDYTDENGTIEINKIPGSGEIEIRVNELENATGYQLIQGEKIAVINKSATTGQIEIIKNKTSEDINVMIDRKNNTVIIELSNIPTTKINKIEFEVVDKNDETIKVGGVDLNTLAPNAENVIYRTTNGYGYACIENPEVPGEGTFEYSTTVTAVPETYHEFLESIKLGITYEAGNIKDIQKIDETIDLDNIDVEYNIENGKDTTIYKAKIKIKLEAKTYYKLQLITTEKDNYDKKIEGAKFEIQSVVNNSNLSSVTKVTNKDGEILTSQASGDKLTIYLKQTETANQYVLDKSVKKLVLSKNNAGDFEIDKAETTEGLNANILDDGTIQIVVENELKVANINFQLIKLDSENEAIRLMGVKLKLFDETNSKEYELTTDESGQVLLEGFKVEKPGEYDFTLKEISTIEGYNLAQLEEGEEIRFKIIYQEIDGQLQIKDVIQESGEDIVTGISYTQTSTDTEFILQLKLIIENTIDENYRYTVNMYKINQDTLELLEGAQIKFNSTFGDNKGITTIIETGINGNASFEIPLVPNDNNFEIEEIVSPLGYKLDNTIKTIVLNKDENTGEVKISNLNNIASSNVKVSNNSIDIFIDNESKEEAESSYQLQLTKLNKEDENITLGDAQYKVEVSSADGSYYREFDNLKTAIETGVAYVSGLRGTGEISIKITETKAPEGYICDTETKVITIVRDIDTNKIEITNISGKNIEAEIDLTTIKVKLTNEKIKVNTKIYKIDKDTKLPISDIGFIFKETTDDGIREFKGKTNEFGVLELPIELLTTGEHFIEIEETETENYEKMAKAKIRIVVGDDGSLSEKEVIEGNIEATIEEGKLRLDIENTLKTYSVGTKITKTNSITGETIKNAKFNFVEIINNTKSENKISVTTDDVGNVDFDLKVKGKGTHIFELEEETMSGYEDLGTARLEIEIGNDGIIQSAQITQGNGITVNIKDGKMELDIVNTPNDKANTIEIIKVNKYDETIKIEGVKFDINGIERTTNKFGIASVSIGIPENTTYKQYTISEKITPAGYLANTGDIKLDINYNTEREIEDAQITQGNEFARIEAIEQDKVTIIVTNEPIKKYSMSFKKVDLLDENKTLSGAKYNIKIEAEDGYINESEITTLEEANSILQELQGYGDIKITLTETEAPNGYKLSEPIVIHLYRDINTKEITFVSKSSNLVDINIEDSNIYFTMKDLPKGSKITIHKVDKKDENVFLPEVVFEINGQEFVTNEDGEIKGYARIQEGEKTKVFTIVEKKTINGYVINPEIKLQVTYNDNGDVILAEIIEGKEFARVISYGKNSIEINITNEKEEYYGIEIVKQDKENELIKIANTKFHVDITNEGDTKNYDLITNSYGIANISSLTGYGDIEIKLKEIETSSNYILDTQEKVINIIRDKDTKEINLISQNGENFILEIDNNNKIIKIIVLNEPVKLGVDIVKIDAEDNDIVLQNVKFKVKVLQNTIELETNENGTVSTDIKQLERNTPYEVEISELSTASGYKLNDKPIKISIKIDDYGNINANLVEGDEFATLVIENNRIKLVIENKKIPEGEYVLELEKQSNLGENIKLENAKYQIKMQKSTNEKIEEISTNSLGIAQIQDITFDEPTVIYITEKEAPEGYYLDEEEKQFTVQLNDNNELEIINEKGENIKIVADDSGKVIRIILIDKSKGINFEIEKVDKDDETIKLSNVGFKVEDKYGVTDKNGIFTTYVGENLINTKKIYTIEETSISSDYIKLDIPTQIEVTFDEQGNITNVEILNNKEYVEFMGIKDGIIKLRFKNTKVKEEPYKIAIIKRDKDNHEILLEGAKYEVNIKSSDGFNKQAEVTTDNSGIAVLDNINGYGDINIELEEKEAPANYKIDQEKKTINIYRDKDTKEFTLNEVSGNNVETQLNNENNLIIITLYDEPIIFNLGIMKVDKEDNNIRLSGVEFTILGTNYTTDENGEINLKMQVPQASKEYELEVKEIKTLSGYKLIGNIKILIQFDTYGNIQKYIITEGEENVKVIFEDGIMKLIISNEKIPQIEDKKYDIILEKVDIEDITKLLSNAKFNISLEKNKNEILNKEYVTDENGKIYLDSITQDDTYTLKIKELLAPNGYICNQNDEVVVFTAENGILTVDKELSSKNIIIEINDNIMKIILKNELEDFKLHIEKFVTKVNDNIIKNMEPRVSIVEGNIEYNINDTDVIHVQNSNIVIYTLRIYNVGNLDGYAESIKDKIPEGLEFIEEHEINKYYGWNKIDDNTIETNILSKDVSENNLIVKHDNQNVYYKEVQVAFRVINLGEDKEIVNIALVDKAKDIYGREKDIEAQSYSKIKVDYFDLSVQKYVSNVIVRKNGIVTKNIGVNLNNIPKVEIRKKELSSTDVQVEYTIVIKNEGNIEGNLLEVKDFIPEGMSFDESSNPNWTIKNNIAIYTQQEMIKPQETKVLTIRLNWNSNFETGLKENVVEIMGENEINLLNNRDTAECFIIASTGIQKEMVILPIVILSMFGLGVYAIRRYVI